MKKILFIGSLLFLSFVLVFGQDSIAIGRIGEEGDEHVDYWLLDKKGKILVDGQTNTAGLHVTRSFLFYGIRDEDGSFQFYAQKRTGSETQDLKNS
jgi:hypothetical protein